MAMAKYGIATIFEDLEVGYEFSPDSIPLHLTHVDSFQIDLSPEQLANRIASALSEQSAFEVMATKDAYYGPNKDKAVTELELTADLVVFHNCIMNLLAAEGAVLKNPQFHNEGYSPHISTYGERKVQVGDVVTIKQLTIASKVADIDTANTRILAVLALKAK